MMGIDWTGTTIDAGGLATRYVRAGQRPAGTRTPILLLHGWPEFRRTWLHNLPVLADHFDVIAPDFRGFGGTPNPFAGSNQGTPPQRLAKDVLAVADALGITRFGIVSHDIGSFVAQQVALAAPDRISGLFFFNCAYPGIGARWGSAENFPELWYQQFHQKDFAAALVGSSREATRIYVRHFLTHWSHQTQAFDPYLEEWVDNFRAPGNLQGGFDWYVGVNRFRTRMMREGGIAQAPIRHPTAFLWGRHDPVLQFAWSDRLGEFFTDHTLACAEDAGHFVHFETPDLANARMIEFFTRIGGHV